MCSNKEKEVKPLFSVVVPAYNSEKFIDKCIDSLLSQTCKDFELILVDDGSVDDTLSVLNFYAEKDSRVRVLHQENGGHTSARNLGLAHSRGEYILFVDSDDWLDLDALEKCENEIRENNSDIIIFGIHCHSETTDYYIFGSFADGFYTVGGDDTRVKDNILMAPDGRFAFPKSLSGKAFKREKIYDIQQSVPRTVLVGEDGAAFVGAVLKSERISVLRDFNYNCITRDGSVSHSSDELALRRCYDLLEFYRSFLDLEDKSLLQQFNRSVVGRLYTAVRFVAASDKGGDWLKKEFEKVLSHEYVRKSLRSAKFSVKGRKLIIKKFILRHRLFSAVNPLGNIKKK